MTEPGTELTTRDRLAPELDRLARLGTWLAASEQRDPDANAKGAAAALRLYYTEQLGLPPLAAAEVTVVSGKLVVSARLLRALAIRAGYRVIAVERTDTSCTAALLSADLGEEIGRATFTLEDAQKAGLIRDRSAWKTHPGRMLWARASAFVIYDYAPDVALGVVTDDELEEIGRRNGPAPEPRPVPHISEPFPTAEEAEFAPIPDPELDGEEGPEESPFVPPPTREGKGN